MYCVSRFQAERHQTLADELVIGIRAFRGKMVYNKTASGVISKPTPKVGGASLEQIKPKKIEDDE